MCQAQYTKQIPFVRIQTIASKFIKNITNFIIADKKEREKIERNTPRRHIVYSLCNVHALTCLVNKSVRYKLTMMCFWCFIRFIHGIRDREIFEIYCLSLHFVYYVLVHLSCMLVRLLSTSFITNANFVFGIFVLIAHRDWINDMDTYCPLF